jgi:DNA-binding PadR family transcriptional regulator
MARRRKLTNPLALSVLSVLTGGPMHPYEIARVLKHWGKEESIKIRYGSLYTVVQDLEKRGLVEAEGTARAGHRPERTVYRLTGEGRQELEERLRELVSEPVKEYPLFASVLSLVAVLHPAEVAVLLGERLRTLELEIVATRATLDELVNVQRLPRVFVLETEYALAMKVAEAEWVRAASKDLADDSLPHVRQWRTWHETGKFPEELLGTSWAQVDQALFGQFTAAKPESGPETAGRAGQETRRETGEPASHGEVNAPD